MKKHYLTLLILLPLFAAAQTTITGTVKDPAGRPLDGVTITLSQQQQLVATAIADLGHFTLNTVPNGTYTLSSMSMGYQPMSRQITFPGTDTLQLILLPTQQQLQGVTISAAKPVIERKADRVIFNVENSIIASGGNAWDALSKAPGVTIASDNSISAYRKGVAVYMDGKPLNISGDDLVSYLQGLPSNLVARVEVLSNPPANFEAQGGAVINIVTKKVKKEGLNVALNGNVTQGVYTGYNASTTFNYRRDKLNIYGNYGFTRRQTYMDNNTRVNYGNSIWDGPNHIVTASNNHTYRLGVDYQLTDNQVLGILVTGNNRTGNNRGFTPTRISSAGKSELDSTIQTGTRGNRKGSGYTYNVNYSLKLDSGKKSLNIDLDYAPYNTGEMSYVSSLTSLPDGTLSSSPYNIYTPTDQHIDIYSAKADYATPIGNTWNMTVGTKYSNIKTRNTFDFYNNTESGLELVPANGNHFQYNESNSALYANFSGTIGQLTVQAGLRAEYTRMRGYSVTLDSLNKREYFKLFPTLFLQYKINDNNEVVVNYGYRIDRPEYARLNPARHYSSPYNYYVGNPALQPAFVHNLELGYTYKQNYNITANYTSTSNLFANVNVQDNATSTYYITHQNLGLSLNTGVHITATVQPASWWSMEIYGGGYYQREKSAFLTGSYDFNQFSYDARLSQSFTINKKKGIIAELIGQHQGPGIQGVYYVRSNSAVDLGVKANILKGKGTIRLAANDIFNTNNYRVSINYLDQQSYFFHRNESKNFQLSLSYRLGKDVKAARTRSTASEEEKRRAN
jgi:hypothetical protein